MPSPTRCPVTGIKPLNRERLLAARIAEALYNANLSLDHSPALKVYDCMEAEIAKWMQAEGIEVNQLPKR